MKETLMSSQSMLNSEFEKMIHNSLLSNFKDLYFDISKLPNSKQEAFFQGLRVSFDYFKVKTLHVYSSHSKLKLESQTPFSFVMSLPTLPFLTDLVRFVNLIIIEMFLAYIKEYKEVDDMPFIPSIIDTSNKQFISIKIDSRKTQFTNDQLEKYLNTYHEVLSNVTNEFLIYISDTYDFKNYSDTFYSVFPEGKKHFGKTYQQTRKPICKNIIFEEDWNTFDDGDYLFMEDD